MEKIQLEAVFLATTYRVVTPVATFMLRVGKPDVVFDAFLRRQRAFSWGIVTACNPGGQLALDQNAGSTKALAARIRAHGWLGFPSINHADAGDWPDEPGYCVLDASEAALCRLGAEFNQAAVVFGETGKGGGRLLWISQEVGGRLERPGG